MNESTVLRNARAGPRSRGWRRAVPQPVHPCGHSSCGAVAGAGSDAVMPV